jgi:hypothetical protein
MVDRCMELQLHTSYTKYTCVYMVSWLPRSFVLKTCKCISVLLKYMKLKATGEELLSVW